MEIKIKNSKFYFLKNLQILFWVYVIVCVVASLQLYCLGPSHYNNYSIFKFSFFNLIHFNDLYSQHPEQHYDLYKYSPTFALFFGVFSFLPDVLGIVLWNLLNALIFFLAVKKLNISSEQKAFVLLFPFVDFITSIQNCQSNGLVAGLMLLAFAFFEAGKKISAIFTAIAGLFLKLFGILSVLFFVFYPGKIKFIFFSMLIFILFFLIPLIVIPPSQLVLLYKSWFNMIQNDKPHELNFSVVGIINTWMQISVNPKTVQLIGGIIFLVPLFLNFKRVSLKVKYLLLASLLIWVVIFNHKAESPSYVIATAGVAIWYIFSARSKLDFILLAFAFVITSLSSSDLFPAALRENFIKPFSLKALPVVLVWIKIQYELIILFLIQKKETAN